MTRNYKSLEFYFVYLKFPFRLSDKNDFYPCGLMLFFVNPIKRVQTSNDISWNYMFSISDKDVISRFSFRNNTSLFWCIPFYVQNLTWEIFLTLNKIYQMQLQGELHQISG